MLRGLRRLPPLETAVLSLGLAVLVTVAVQGRRGDSAAPLDSYSTYDAASGGYRAFYELLAREGIAVDRFELRPAFLGSETDTLVWAEPLAFDPRQLASTAADVGALERWVRAGGALLYLGYDDRAAARGILGLPRTRVAAAGRERPRISAPLARAGIARLEIPGARRYALERGSRRALYADGRGVVAVRYSLGRGRVTAMIAQAAFSNGELARGDAARLAVALASPRVPGGRVVFDEAVHGYVVPEHWWQIVPRPFALALACAGGVLLIAFAGAAVRLGPPLPSEPLEERTTGDFIEALAGLLARGKAARFVLARVVASTASLVARARRLGTAVSHGEIAAAIEDEAAKDDFGALVAVAAGGSTDDAALVRGVALAQRLRKDYEKYDVRGRRRD